MNYILSQFNKLLFCYMLFVSLSQYGVPFSNTPSGIDFYITLILILTYISCFFVCMKETVDLGFDKETFGEDIIKLTDCRRYSIKPIDIYLVNTMFFIILYGICLFSTLALMYSGITSLLCFTICMLLVFSTIVFIQTYYYFINILKG
ncbi:hypothetical protein SJ_196 [Proteus phage SJ_PmiM]|nr:hypothetical protein SJ_196 [Proteus phage SJ_PmiM]